MSIKREGRDYLLIGAGQFLLDWATMVGLSHLGVEIHIANVIGRLGAALVGFWLNGKITFRARGAQVGRVQLLRFVLLWLGTTVAGTWTIGSVDHQGGLYVAWLAKPLIEIMLAVVTFLIARHWVYRKTVDV